MNLENNITNHEEKLLDIQIITTIIYIGSLVLSIYLTLNDKKILRNENPLFSDRTSKKYSIFNRFLVVILTLSYLYISYENVKVAKIRNKNVWANKLQLNASEISLIATLIVLYVVIKTSGEESSIISGISNPNL